MIYTNMLGERISALGFGCMRLPQVSEDPNSPIDEEKTAEVFKLAFDNGINYFDTGFGYHNGSCEATVGRILSNYPRDSYYLAGKFPGYEVRESWDPKAQFELQLANCGVDYFDFYMLHNVYENNIDTYLDERWNITEYLIEQKKAGRIKHLGFSTHGMLPCNKQLIEAYGEHMEFCQMQLNYLDWKLQDAKATYEYLISINMPIIVMEPVRGGALAKLSPENTAMLKAARPDESVAAWSFRFLQGLPGIMTTLSGMSNYEQTLDNINTYKESKPLNAEELELVAKVRESMLDILPCTNCRYCTKDCPVGLEIPELLSFYNNHKFLPNFMAPMYVGGLPEDKKPGACIECGQCTQVCPQNIKIPEALKDFQNMMDTYGE